ncbi:DUF2793 domain-containing protein [Rhodobacter capsulatus]|uniref:DUF2793 domain-containing protein n=1 Tax=Rhodobacter capsulatus TaxID=1061 RepID=UPI00402661D6
MADQTPLLGLPLILPSQAQKHVTHNEALSLLDAIVQLAVLDRVRTAPPASPQTGDRHIVAPRAKRRPGPGRTGRWRFGPAAAGCLRSRSRAGRRGICRTGRF